MYAPERQNEIVARARAAGRVDVATLAAELDVAAETVRRDLTVLERRGLLRRVHGGAVPVERLTLEPSVDERDLANTDAKDAIARAALARFRATPELHVAVFVRTEADMADAIAELDERRQSPPVVILGTPPEFINFGDAATILATLGLDGPGIAAAVLKARAASDIDLS